MRKLFTALTLLLCLVLCVFAFASCDKKTKGEAKTTAVTTAGHVHEPNDDYTVDVKATCLNAGSKSIHCKTCGASIPGTEVALDQLEHVPSDYRTDYPPTCQSDGAESKYCTLCGTKLTDTTKPIDADPEAHVVDDWVTVEPTLLADGSKTGTCQLCSAPVNRVLEFEHDIQIFTTSKNNKYSGGSDTLGNIRGDKHFYDEGNDLLVEYSVLWNDTLLHLLTTNKAMPTIDTRFAANAAGTSGNSGIVRWELANDVESQWCSCKFAGGFEVAAFGTSEDDNPYPNYNKIKSDDITDYPNIGGANAGGGKPLGETQWGWHRVSIRFRETVTNLEAVKTGVEATYKLEVWVYIDGVFVLHYSGADHIWSSGDKSDRKLFSVTSDGEGGVVYTENDHLYLHGAFLDTSKMAEGKGYFEIADYSATIGSDFVQNVRKVTSPVPTTLEVEADVTVPSTMWYELAD